jgi:hypothetical protein
MTVALENLMTVKQLAAAYPAFTEPMIRWWIFNANTNGFNVCIIRIGGRVLIDRAAFEHWLEAHRTASFTPEPA